ncbi:alpha/beta fold hydrolase [Winogradskyella eckloniae]|uniref:alpha/beta hydrolase family protein n=1 Tax=Winogradskyella eckloniae TaxID=1089306 RepID=UPI0015632AC4|nr:alpha/beta fold hydrolase [Winogradskyella eckloniae]NRD18714.1 alpha/beta fold hydrolase [Winogradskyella eckloniae]
MTIDKNIILTRDGKKPILIDAFYSNEIDNQPIVIFCHGYKGFKDWGSWNLMAETFSKLGFCFIKFNFSHNGGTMENPIDFPDLDAFGNNNYTKELDDLADIITWVKDHFKAHSKINTKHITLIGHSRGGGISILKAAEDDRITNLITLASVSDFAKRTATIGNLEAWKHNGVTYIVNGRTKQQMPHYYQFYQDFIIHKARLDIESATKRLSIPHLIIHGSNDTSVKLEEGKALHKWNSNSELKIINNADHVFNTKHPWDKDQLTTALLETINACVAFLQKQN